MSKYKILCVDDEENILTLYEIMLEKLGHEVVGCRTFEDALEFVKNHGNEIVYIFSDYTIGEANGLDFRKMVNETGFDIPFSLITGYYNKRMTIEGMELGISSFIEKPFEEEKLITLYSGFGEKRRLLLDEEKEMVISFIEESYPMLLEIENLIMSLESEPENTVFLNTYFRLLHTIKGTASCVGLKCLPKFAHKYEDLVVKLQNKSIALTPTVADVLLKGLDYLKFMYDQIQKGVFEFDIQESLLMFDFENTKSSTSDPIAKKELEVDVVKKQSASVEQAEERIGVPVSTLNDFMELSGQITVIRNTLLKSAIVLGQRYHGDNELEILLDSES
jgi:two-component system chemotaxis sensor kinase CheA